MKMMKLLEIITTTTMMSMTMMTFTTRNVCRFALRSSQRKPRSPRLEPRGVQGGKTKVISVFFST